MYAASYMQEVTQFPERRHLPKMLGYDAEEEPHPNLPPIPSLPRIMQHIKEIRSIKSIKYKFHQAVGAAPSPPRQRSEIDPGGGGAGLVGG